MKWRKVDWSKADWSKEQVPHEARIIPFTEITANLCQPVCRSPRTVERSNATTNALREAIQIRRRVQKGDVEFSETDLNGINLDARTVTPSHFIDVGSPTGLHYSTHVCTAVRLVSHLSRVHCYISILFTLRLYRSVDCLDRIYSCTVPYGRPV